MQVSKRQNYWRVKKQRSEISISSKACYPVLSFVPHFHFSMNLKWKLHPSHLTSTPCWKLLPFTCFLLYLVCYLYLDNNVLVFHCVHRAHLNEMFSYNNIFCTAVSGISDFFLLAGVKKNRKGEEEKST